MARYDERFGPRQAGRYDQAWARGSGPGAMPQMGRAPEGRRGGGADADYDREYGPDRFRSGGFGGGSGSEQWQDGGDSVYGPSRYGLGPYYQRLLNRRRPDDELKEEVGEALFYDSWVDAEAISVEVDDGIVTLRGSLPNYEEVRYAIDDAWDVDGVRGVRSELDVRERSRR
jgi:hypothetical protein